jgi:conserved oligomeric Golgi complex subunit 4
MWWHACREIRALTSGLAELTGHPVRERCTRLNQMVVLLTLESVDEVNEVWADSSIAWRLSAAEVRSVLACRADLDPSSIASLLLE